MNSLEAGISCRKCLLKTLRDFPGSPVVKTPSYRDVSLIFGRGTKIPRAMPKFFLKRKKIPNFRLFSLRYLFPVLLYSFPGKESSFGYHLPINKYNKIKKKEISKVLR